MGMNIGGIGFLAGKLAHWGSRLSVGTTTSIVMRVRT